MTIDFTRDELQLLDDCILKLIMLSKLLEKKRKEAK